MSDLSKFGKWISNPPLGEEVVVSGISGRFPNSENVKEFQDNLFNKRDMVSGDDRRWNLNHPEVPQRTGKIDNINKLDAGYFGLHYRQADIMDPMMRKFLEVVIETVIDAGINPSELEGSRTAVYVGACFADMETEILNTITKPQSFGVTGTIRSLLANRISYFLKLKGPSCIADTACSSSFNAFELAYKMIRLGKCDQALVGGANLLLHPGISRQFFRLGVLSPDGACKVFDESANGYAKGETIACVFLQKAKDARRIYAQVVHAKVNSDGFKSIGITFPSTQVQNDLMTEVLQDSGVNPNELSFMEAHGTGTQAGDPQEVEAIDNAIAKKRAKPLLIGAVKCSVGHTEPSSGLCSIAKVLIALETGFIPPNIHLKKVKKGLTGIEEGRMIPVTEATKLDTDDALIGINNFGFGGSNVHLLLRRFAKLKKYRGMIEDDLPRLICVSARSEEGVASLLDSVTDRPLDSEYIGLLHQIFKREISGHCFRGFCVVSKTGSVQTEIKRVVSHKPLYVVFGKFVNRYRNLSQSLMEFPSFKATLTKITDLVEEQIGPQTGTKIENDLLSSFAIQIGMIDVLKLLEIEANVLCSDSLGKLLVSYYNENLTLKEATSDVCSYINNTILKSVQPRSAKIFEKTSKDKYFLSYVNLKNSNEKCLILNMSDEILNGKNNFHLNDNNSLTILEILGRLYEEGYYPQIHKLYPPVQFPVSRATPMISPFIKWDQHKNWFTYKFGNLVSDDTIQKEYNISPLINEGQKYITGHVIDGRNLVPATAYLHLVWQTLLQNYRLAEIKEPPLVFENCKFIRAVTIPKGGTVKLLVSIRKGSGNFEVVEKNSVVVSGRIFLTKNVEKYFTDLAPYQMSENRSEFLDQDEIYRELYLRGYNYSDLFKGIVKCNVDASAALVQWERNWIAFLDKMLQVKVLQMDTKLLYVPVGIKKIVVEPEKHQAFAENQKEFLCPVYNYKDCNILKCGRVEIQGLQAAAISRKKSNVIPVLEKYLFIPNHFETNLEQLARIVTQIILENSLESNFKAVEVVDDSSNTRSELLLPLVSKALDDLPLVTLDLTVSSKNQIETLPTIKVDNVTLSTSNNLLLIVATKILQNSSLLNQAFNALSPSGYVLSREELDFLPEIDSSVEILTEHVTPTEKLFLIRKRLQEKRTEFVEVSSNNFEWLPQLKKVLKQGSDVVIYSQNSELEGVLGLVNCLRREPDGRKVRCFFTMDQVPKFDPENTFYKEQIRKQLAVNIFKDGKWGTYRHLVLEDVEEVNSENIFVHNTIKGDLASLKWVQGSLNLQTKLPKNYKIVFPYYCGINFKDIMVASGRVHIGTITQDRLEQECPLGFEFSGRDIKGRRVAGMSDTKSTASIIAADSTFLWEIPENWSLEEASTVVVVYCTVLYALFKTITIKPGMSILIHSGTGGIGLAALNVCLYHGLEVFVTVGTQEKKNYLRKHYPQIPESRIGNSRDTSFEEMIKFETKNRGVDIVLNSLSEEKLKASIRCVAPGGHFLEIGKYDLQNDSSIETLFLERNISYHGVMLDRVYSNSQASKRWLLEKIEEGVRLGYVKPIPRTIFRKDEIVEAYKYMTTGKHIGKVVVKLYEENVKIDSVKGKLHKAYPRFGCDPDKSYIIIGGLGGFGLELADWLYLRGAKKLILVSRSGIQTGYQTQKIRNWSISGVKVQVSTKDVTTLQGCLDLINEAKNLGPIDAIFNLAVVLKDALFEDQTEDSFNTSLAPKARTTINLDKITREHCPDLRHFIIFSSVSCGRGNTGQTNYGMANSIMERVCEKRKQDRLPGLAIQWGAIGDVGLVAKMQKENKELVIGGTLQQKISSCLEVLDKFLNQNHPVVSSMVVAEKIDRSASSGSAVDAVAYILGIKDIKTVSPHTCFAELGMDSMMGTEVIQILEKDFEIYITAKEARTLTFAGLIELEEEKRKYSEGNIKNESFNREFLQYIPVDNSNNAPITKMPSQDGQSGKTPTIFILTGIEGIVQILEPLTQNLKTLVFALEYNTTECTIQDMAKRILELIEETVSNEGTFFLIGYSFGGVVATELTALLESKGYIGTFIAIESSPAYLHAVALDSFPTLDDVTLQTSLIFRCLIILMPLGQLNALKEKLASCQTFDERFELGLSLVPPEVGKQVTKEGIIGLYHRCKAISNYKFSHAKIKSRVFLYKAKFGILSNFADDYQFSELCQNPVQITVLDSNHSTILKQDKLYEDINKIIVE